MCVCVFVCADHEFGGEGGSVRLLGEREDIVREKNRCSNEGIALQEEVTRKTVKLTVLKEMSKQLVKIVLSIITQNSLLVSQLT